RVDSGSERTEAARRARAGAGTADERGARRGAAVEMIEDLLAVAATGLAVGDGVAVVGGPTADQRVRVDDRAGLAADAGREDLRGRAADEIPAHVTTGRQRGPAAEHVRAHRGASSRQAERHHHGAGEQLGAGGPHSVTLESGVTPSRYTAMWRHNGH